MKAMKAAKGWKINPTDWGLLVALAAAVGIYAATKNPLSGMGGLAVLLALLARDVFSGEKRQYKDFIQLLGLRLRVPTLLAASALLCLAAAYFSADIIRLFSAILFFANAAALGAKYAGFKSESLPGAVAELDSAFFAALFAWLAMGFILNTSTPLDVVTSCSMVPNLDRGDLIILQGGAVNAPTVEYDKATIAASDFLREICTVADTQTGAEFNTLCTSGLRLNGTEYKFGHSTDIVVYEPPAPSSIGLIVHRAVLKLRIDGKAYYITKGDNNPVTDIEGIIAMPPTDKDIRGKMIARIPYIGYLKLFLALQFDEPPACRRVLSANGIALNNPSGNN
ncbi:MAG: hypothetical protein V1708_01530 [Candidatus Micrarchaeota archaeon]